MIERGQFSVRDLAFEDLGEALKLSRAVGWGHRLEDWHKMFEIGLGYVAVNSGNSICGVAMWWPYDREFATLGMIIVSPTLQKSGIGRKLVDAIIGAAGNRRLMLAATDEGLKLYESLGFVRSGKICTYSGVPLIDKKAAMPGNNVRRMEEKDWLQIYLLDHEATLMDRSAFLNSIIGRSSGFVIQSEGAVTGFAISRPFGQAVVLGPIVAATERDAIELASAAASYVEGNLRVDMPEDAGELSGWLERAGLVEVGSGTIMWRPSVPQHVGAVRVYGLASQALG